MDINNLKNFFYNIINKKKNIPHGLNNKIIFKHMDIYQNFNVE